ncbi:MAG: SWIM zinc finger family protein [Chloroflexota bacterium]
MSGDRASGGGSNRRRRRPPSDQPPRPQGSPPSDQASRPQGSPPSDQPPRPQGRPPSDQATRKSGRPPADQAARKPGRPPADQATRKPGRPPADQAPRPQGRRPPGRPPGQEPRPPRPPKDGIRSATRRGAFGKNWWATRWIAAMERLVDNGRLARGRSYARNGHVLAIDEQKDGVEARVQGSRRTPYKVKIQVTPLPDKAWERVIDALAEQALFTAQLLAGEMPQDIERAFQRAGSSLFPDKRSELTTSCSCPDWANPCKHVAAVHYILGERFDEDPFLLLRMRGRSQQQILAGLRKRRAGGAPSRTEPAPAADADTAVPLERLLDDYWGPGDTLDGLAVSVRSPAVETPLLKRLGDPAFLPGLQELLLPAYRAIQMAALQAAFGDPEAQDGE